MNNDDIAFFKSLSHVKTISFEGLPAIAEYHGSHDSKGKKLKLNGTVLSRAMQLLHNDTGKGCWPDIPKGYWEKAVDELIGHRPSD